MSKLLKMLEQFDDNVTVGQVIKKIREDRKEKDLEEEYIFDALKEEYNDSYLKVVEEGGLFGRTLSVYHIEEIISKERTTDWELYYTARVKRLQFTSTEVFDANMDGDDVYFSFSEVDLRAMTKITEEDFEDYIFKCNEIKGKLAKIIE